MNKISEGISFILLHTKGSYTPKELCEKSQWYHWVNLHEVTKCYKTLLSVVGALNNEITGSQ